MSEAQYSRRTFLKKCVTYIGAAALFTYTLPEAGAEETVKEVRDMPHVVIKMYPGASEDEKSRLADAIVQDFENILGKSERSVSIAIEDVDPSEWKEKVYDTEIKPKMDKLYKKPGYSM